MRRFAVIAIAAVATGLIVGIVIADSGGSGGGTASVPELKPPPGTIKGDTGTTGEQTSSVETTPAQTQTQAPTTTPSGGTAAPQNDTPTHDVAPPQGSPAQRFEQFCKDNPGAC
jgi:hypothetical protein